VRRGLEEDAPVSLPAPWNGLRKLGVIQLEKVWRLLKKSKVHQGGRKGGPARQAWKVREAGIGQKAAGPLNCGGQKGAPGPESSWRRPKKD